MNIQAKLSKTGAKQMHRTRHHHTRSDYRSRRG